MNDEQTIDYYLKFAWQSVANKYNQIAVRYGITQVTGYILINIRREGVAVHQLANLLGVRTTSLSRILNSLEGAGLIYRAVNTEDKRSVKIFLTPLGVEKRKIAKRVVTDFNEHLNAEMTPEERKILIETLARITASVDRYRPKEELEEEQIEEEFA